jgi:hypothetical protein
MNTKKMLVLAAAAVLGLAGRVWAADPDSEAFTIKIMPSVDVGVDVDTTGAGWTDGGNLDTTMDLGSEKILVTGVKVTVKGNFNKQELQLLGGNSDSWSLDTDETPGANQVRLYGLLGANQDQAPASGLFSGVANLITTAAGQQAGQSQSDEDSGPDAGSKKYELATTDAPYYEDVDDMAVNQMRRLWLRVNTPSISSSDEQQSIVITVTAVKGAAS